MNKNVTYLFLIAAITAILAALILTKEVDHSVNDDGHEGAGEHSEEEVEKGPHRGRLLHDGSLALEITIFEAGVPPQFRVYAYQDNKPLSPQEVQLEIDLARLDGAVDKHRFVAKEDFLEGDNVVTEPHSFDVEIRATYNGKSYQWQYDNYEGRVEISPDMAVANGIKTEPAGSATVKETLTLNGRVSLDPNRLSHSRARYPGIVKSVRRDLGDTVKKGDVLAVVQSNESLQNYNIAAAINGVIVQRDVQPGESTGNHALFTIADTSSIWVELDVFDKDLDRVKTGQSVALETLSGTRVTGKIDWLSPMAAHASQSIQARVILSNKKNLFRPGQFIRGQVTIGEIAAPLAVRRSGIQAFRDFQVVYAKVGDVYEVRMLELGRNDSEWIEVLGGLKPGTEYVSENSYLIKADIEKSGASHDH